MRVREKWGLDANFFSSLLKLSQRTMTLLRQDESERNRIKLYENENYFFRLLFGSVIIVDRFSHHRVCVSCCHVKECPGFVWHPISALTTSDTDKKNASKREKKPEIKSTQLRKSERFCDASPSLFSLLTMSMIRPPPGSPHRTQTHSSIIECG